MTPSSRPLLLDISALSAEEYAAYLEYYQQLSVEARPDNLPSLALQDLREFAESRLGIPPPTFDCVWLTLRSSRFVLQPSLVLALFRLLAHERQSGTSLTSQHVFIPAKPAPLRSSRQARDDQRESLPTSEPSQASCSHFDTSTNNPFRRRHVSQPNSRSGLPPPLPPRKVQRVPTLPVREAEQRYGTVSTPYPDANPTSLSDPSAIIRKSLAAANNRTQIDRELSVHVIKKSSPQNLSRRSALVEEVASALRQSGMNDEPSFATIAQKYREEEPLITVWDCTDVLADVSAPPKYAMVIVNQPIRDRDIFSRAWDASSIRLCADGGANRLFDLWEGDVPGRYLPDMIKGDLDSIRDDVRMYYLSKGVTILRDRDEYSTDLMKCIAEIEKREEAEQYPLLIVGGLSGRIDQTIHTLSLLHKIRQRRPQTYVLSGESLAWVLDEGSHLLNIDHLTMGQTCGILPIGIDGANVSTRGLKWNLDWLTSFDGDVSTSNHLLPEEPVVYVKTDRPVMWCVEVREAST